MSSFKVFRSFAIALSATIFFACADSPTAPVPSAAPEATVIAFDGGQKDLLGGLLGGVVNALTKVVNSVLHPEGIPVKPVEWADTHSNQVRTVSGTIGRWGGTLSIPGSDFTIAFPYGALSEPTAITITSDASGYVSYDMQPHGLRFAKPVVVTQRLRNTKAYGTPLAKELFGAYVPDASLLGGIINSVLNATEIVTSVTLFRPDGTAEVQTWMLNHFSRYMLASG